MLTGWILNVSSSWNLVFAVAACVYFFGAIVFILLASDHPIEQPLQEMETATTPLDTASTITVKQSDVAVTKH